MNIKTASMESRNISSHWSPPRTRFFSPLQRTSRCASSETRGKVKARSLRPTSTGRSPSCSARRPTAIRTWRSRWEWRCSSAGRQTARSASPWTSSISPPTQVTYDVISVLSEALFSFCNILIHNSLHHLKRIDKYFLIMEFFFPKISYWLSVIS